MDNLLRPLQWQFSQGNWEATDFKGRLHVVPNNKFSQNGNLAGPDFSAVIEIQKQVNDEFVQWLNPQLIKKLAA